MYMDSVVHRELGFQPLPLYVVAALALIGLLLVMASVAILGGSILLACKVAPLVQLAFQMMKVAGRTLRLAAYRTLVKIRCVYLGPAQAVLEMQLQLYRTMTLLSFLLLHPQESQFVLKLPCAPRQPPNERCAVYFHHME